VVGVAFATHATPGMAKKNAAEPGSLVPDIHLDHDIAQLMRITLI
jgi:hypothetical protein